MGSISVLIAEDHAVVREGTREVLLRDPGLDVIGETGTAEGALAAVASERPDVLLLDLALPDRSGIDVLKQVCSAYQETKVLILSAYDDYDYVVAAIEAGAAGYLIKSIRGSELIDAIYAVTRGQIVLHPRVVEKLRSSLQRGDGPELQMPQMLSPREIEILRVASTGRRNKEIAQGMNISVRTVEAHFSHIFTKLNVSSRTEAVIHGAARHWFDLD